MIHTHQFSREDGHRTFFQWEGDKGQTGTANSQGLAPRSREMNVNFIIFPPIFSQLLDVWEEKEVIQNQLWLSTTLLHFGLLFVLCLQPIVSCMNWFLPPHSVISQSQWCETNFKAIEITYEETTQVCFSGLAKKIPFKYTERFPKFKASFGLGYDIKTVFGKSLGFKLRYPFRSHEIWLIEASLTHKI